MPRIGVDWRAATGRTTLTATLEQLDRDKSLTISIDELVGSDGPGAHTSVDPIGKVVRALVREVGNMEVLRDVLDIHRTGRVKPLELEAAIAEFGVDWRHESALTDLHELLLPCFEDKDGAISVAEFLGDSIPGLISEAQKKLPVWQRDHSGDGDGENARAFSPRTNRSARPRGDGNQVSPRGMTDEEVQKWYKKKLERSDNIAAASEVKLNREAGLAADFNAWQGVSFGRPHSKAVGRPEINYRIAAYGDAWDASAQGTRVSNADRFKGLPNDSHWGSSAGKTSVKMQRPGTSHGQAAHHG